MMDPFAAGLITNLSNLSAAGLITNRSNLSPILSSLDDLIRRAWLKFEEDVEYLKSLVLAGAPSVSDKIEPRANSKAANPSYQRTSTTWMPGSEDEISVRPEVLRGHGEKFRRVPMHKALFYIADCYFGAGKRYTSQRAYIETVCDGLFTYSTFCNWARYLEEQDFLSRSRREIYWDRIIEPRDS